MTLGEYISVTIRLLAKNVVIAFIDIQIGSPAFNRNFSQAKPLFELLVSGFF